MKNPLCPATAIFYLLAIVMGTIVPIDYAISGSYLTHVTVTTTTIAHSDGSTTSYVSNVHKEYGYHSFQGSHQHESPSVSFEHNFEECTQCFDVG